MQYSGGNYAYSSVPNGANAMGAAGGRMGLNGGVGGSAMLSNGGGGVGGSTFHPSGMYAAHANTQVRPTGAATLHGGVVVQPNPGCGLGTPANDTACCVGGPENTCGGVGSVCFEGSGNMVATTDYCYVGDGRGEYSAVPNYSYVGEGAGSYAKDVIVTPYGCRLKPCCIVILLLWLLLPLLWWLLGPAGPIIIPPKGPIGVCKLWGDPHILTFDHMRADYYSPGEFWIVKSDNVWIQGRYLPTKVTSGLGVTKSIAIGGPFLKGHKLIVAVRSATWDGQQVLTGFPSDFSVPGIVGMHYNNVGTLLQKGRQGKALHVVHIRLEDGSSEGIQIQVNRWMEPTEGDYMNVMIRMHGQPGQDGHCGNFNGVREDDDRLQVRARVGKTGVDPNLLLYHTKTPVVVANRPNINDCPAEKLDQAKASCKAKEQKLIPSMGCLIDVCFAGVGFANQA